MLRRLLWLVAFFALVVRAIQRIGWVKPPEPEPTEPLWNPLPVRDGQVGSA